MGAFDAIMEPGLFLIRRYGPEKKDALGRITRPLLSETRVNGLLDPSGTAEGEAFVVDQFRATLPLGTDLRPSDEVVARGKTYTVEGTPFDAVVPRTQIGVMQAVLKYVGRVT